MTYLVLIIILLLAYHYEPKITAWVKSLKSEKYTPCLDCGKYKMASTDTIGLNPFMYPYSATQDIDSLYILNKDKNIDVGFGVIKPIRKSDADHTIAVGQTHGDY